MTFDLSRYIPEFLMLGGTLIAMLAVPFRITVIVLLGGVVSVVGMVMFISSGISI